MYNRITWHFVCLTGYNVMLMQEERTMLAKELSSLRDQKEQLQAEVEKYRECDPQVVEEIRKFVLVPKSS